MKFRPVHEPETRSDALAREVRKYLLTMSRVRSAQRLRLCLKLGSGFGHQSRQPRDGWFATSDRSRRSFPNARSLASCVREKILPLRRQPDLQFASDGKSAGARRRFQHHQANATASEYRKAVCVTDLSARRRIALVLPGLCCAVSAPLPSDGPRPIFAQCAHSSAQTRRRVGRAVFVIDLLQERQDLGPAIRGDSSPLS